MAPKSIRLEAGARRPNCGPCRDRKTNLWPRNISLFVLNTLMPVVILIVSSGQSQFQAATATGAQQLATTPSTTSTSTAASSNTAIQKIAIDSIKNVTFLELRSNPSGQATSSSNNVRANQQHASASTSTSNPMTTTLRIPTSTGAHQLAGPSAASLLVSSLPPPPATSQQPAALDALSTSASTVSGSVAHAPPAQVTPLAQLSTRVKPNATNTNNNMKNHQAHRSQAQTNSPFRLVTDESSVGGGQTKPPKVVKKSTNLKRKLEAKLPVKMNTNNKSKVAPHQAENGSHNKTRTNPSSTTTTSTTQSSPTHGSGTQSQASLSRALPAGQPTTAATTSELDQMSSSQSLRFSQKQQQINANNHKQKQVASSSSKAADATPSAQVPFPSAPSNFGQQTSASIQSANIIEPSATINTNNGKSSARWTHFGARLKPLQGASNSNKQQQLQSAPDHQARDSRAKLSIAMPVAAASSTNSDSDDADDDDQDSEAMLYSMFAQAAGQNNMRPSTRNVDGARQQQWSPVDSSSGNSRPASQQQPVGPSRRVIKLMKSYSHIHQVDDSGDQPRGSPRLGLSPRTKAPIGQQPRAGVVSSRQDNNLRPQSNAYQASNSRARPHESATNSLDDNSDDDDSSSEGDEKRGATHSLHRPALQPRPEASEQSAGDQSPSSNQQPGGAAGGPPEDEEFECPDDGIFADEASGCQSYLVCQSGAQVQQRFQCPLGTLFNNIILTCDFAHNVQCGKAKPAASSSSSQFDPNDQLRGQTSSSSSQNHQSNSQAPRPKYQQLPQPWQQHYPPSPSLAAPQQQQASALNLRPSTPSYVHAQQPPASNSGDSDPDDDSDEQANQQPNSRPASSSSDYEGGEALVAATLPPARNQRPQASGSFALAYKAPPSAQARHQLQQQSHHQPQNPSNPNQNQYPQSNSEFHSAHRSHYPAHFSPAASYNQLRPSNYETDPAAANYDGASAVTPVYAEMQSPALKQQSNGQKEANQLSSFNLLIDHVTSPANRGAATQHHHDSNIPMIQAKQHPAASAPAARSQPEATTNIYINPRLSSNPTSPTDQNPDSKQPHPKPQTSSSFHSIRAQLPNQQQAPVIAKQPLEQVASQQNRANNNRNQQQQFSHQLQSQSQSSLQQQYARLASASQGKPVHANPTTINNQNNDLANNKNPHSRPAEFSRQPTVIDLTDEKQVGVTSEAMNNGLLLIVRHESPLSHSRSRTSSQSGGPGSNAAPSSVSSSHAAPPSQNQQQQYGTSGTSTNSRAFAIDPILLSPNAPMDGQLFPNVQRVLAQNKGLISGPLNQPKRLQQQQHSSPSSQMPRFQSLHQALPPMEPPRPTLIETTSHLAGSESQRPPSSTSIIGNSDFSSVEPAFNVVLASTAGSGFEAGGGGRGSTTTLSSQRLDINDVTSRSSELSSSSSTTQSSIDTGTSPQTVVTSGAPLRVQTNKRLKPVKAPETKANHHHHSHQ